MVDGESVMRMRERGDGADLDILVVGEVRPAMSARVLASGPCESRSGHWGGGWESDRTFLSEIVHSS